MSVLDTLGSVKEYIGWDKHQIDDAIFRLHSKVTATIILTFCLIVTASQFIGDPIDCVVEQIDSGVMDTYCWIHSTFTLPKLILEKTTGDTVAPGVGVPSYENGPIVRHKYYQWVCFILFLQMVCFRIPSFIWHKWESKRVQTVLPKKMFIQVSDSRMPNFPKLPIFLKEDEIDGSVNDMKDFIEYHIGKRRYNSYYVKYQVCEWLNLFNVIFQMLFLDLFLGGMFSTYGSAVWGISNMDPEERSDPMNLVFPKVGKCTFRSVGASGTIQLIDGMCVLPINIFNEKIFAFMWTWFVFLAIVSALGLCYRAITLISVRARASVLMAKSSLLLDDVVALRVTDKLRKGDWFFLTLIGANLDPEIFTRLVNQLDKSLNRRTAMGNGTVSNTKLEKIA